MFTFSPVDLLVLLTTALFSLSPMELLILLSLSAGNPANEMVSLLDAESYFKKHEIAVTVEKMTELAGKDPADAKTQVAQLLALRWLGDHAEQVKKDDKARAMLERVAQGKQAQDSAGFARDYAQRALARLEGKPAPARPAIPAGSLRTEALRWFPSDVTFVAGAEFRASGEIKSPEQDPAQLLGKLLPPEAQEEMIKFADQVGNFRVDRVAVALPMDARGNPEAVYVRFTGAGNLKRWSAFLAKQIPEGKLSEVKGPRDETITLLASEKVQPALAFFGDTDVLLAVSPGKPGKERELLDKALEVRAGQKPSAAAGPLKDLLRDVPAQAFAMVVTELNEVQRQQLTGGNSPFKAAPQRLALEMSRDKAIQVRFRARFKDADEAKTFVAAVDTLKKQALDGLKNLPPELKIPPALVKLAGNILGDAGVQARGAEVVGNATLPAEFPAAVKDLLQNHSRPGPREEKRPGPQSKVTVPALDRFPSWIGGRPTQDG